MPKYSPLPHNSEVMDVLCCVILGYNRVNQIMNILNQPQSTVSEKLRFLRKNRVIKKSKWSYKANWSVLLRFLRNAIKQECVVNKELLSLFDNNRLERIMTAYAKMVIDLKHKPVSIREMIWKYLLGLCQTHSNELKSIDKKFVKLKNELMAMSEEMCLFMTSEEV